MPRRGEPRPRPRSAPRPVVAAAGACLAAILPGGPGCADDAAPAAAIVPASSVDAPAGIEGGAAPAEDAPSSTAPAPVAAALEEADAPVPSLEAAVVERINDVRAEHGLSPLQRDEVLDEVARGWSARMAEEGFFSHGGPDGSSVADRVRAAGVRYRLVGENISMSRNLADPIEVAVEGWMDSPGHRANILEPGFTRTGVGVRRDGDRLWITQVFHRPP